MRQFAVFLILLSIPSTRSYGTPVASFDLVPVCVPSAPGTAPEKLSLSLPLPGSEQQAPPTHCTATLSGPETKAKSDPASIAVTAAPVPIANAVEGIRASVRQTVEVQAAPETLGVLGDTSSRVTSAELQTTAGTLDDPTRYFQILPGVQSDSDQRNDFLVRGGNPTENLFVIDGVAVPSINHLALSDTTGGLVSMIDADAIESMTLHAGVHDARFDDRLSSVVEISTRDEGAVGPGSGPAPDKRPSRRVVEAGIAGVGGIFSWQAKGSSASPSSVRGSTLISIRQGVLDLLTSDVGLNGVPRYTNALIRGDRELGTRDRLWGISLTGIDSILVKPSATDTQETNPFDIDYHGWRSTTGTNWQHLWSPRTFGVLTVSDAEQSQTIVQSDQLLNGTPTYTERTLDGDTTAKYEVTSQARPWLLASGGATVSLQRVDYDLDQPVALPTPYSVNPNAGSAPSSSSFNTAATSTSLSAAFSTATQGGFAQTTFLLPDGVRITAATRVTHWGFDGHTLFTPRALVAVPLGHDRTASAGFADYAQMPPFLYRLAYPQNHALLPIRVQHLTFDLLNLVRTRTFALQLSAYDKRYMDYPVASGYPQLSLANIADTFGQSFLLFPMTSKGRGRADGVEASLQYRPVHRVTVQASVTYARCRFSGLDGVLRPGNFDVPFSAKLSGAWTIGHGYTLSMRYDGASGRPYTPDNLSESAAQARDIYDLARINGARSRAYGRMDFRFGQTRRVGTGLLSWHVGLDNALNQKNFYQYLWQPRIHGSESGVSEQDQMPRFPDGGLNYTF